MSRFWTRFTDWGKKISARLEPLRLRILEKHAGNGVVVERNLKER